MLESPIDHIEVGKNVRVMLTTKLVKTFGVTEP
jgi:hypothetical protein